MAFKVQCYIIIKYTVDVRNSESLAVIKVASFVLINSHRTIAAKRSFVLLYIRAALKKVFTYNATSN